MESKRPLHPGDFHTAPAKPTSGDTYAKRSIRVLRDQQETGLYQKPEPISMYSTNSVPLFWQDRAYFIETQLHMIESYVSAQDLTISLMENDHITAVIEFLHRRYPKALASEIGSFDLWRFLEYGHGILLWDDTGKVQGCIFEIGYRRKPDTSFTIRLAVAEELEGKNLGYHLMLYSCLLAMQEGAKVKRGLIQFGNHKSLYINLNKVGWICESYIPDAGGLGPFFEIALPLDPAGLFTNAVDQESIHDYLEGYEQHFDYRILNASDQRSIARMYEASDFKIVALLKKGIVSDHNSFLALPASSISLHA